MVLLNSDERTIAKQTGLSGGNLCQQGRRRCQRRSSLCRRSRFCDLPPSMGLWKAAIALAATPSASPSASIRLWAGVQKYNKVMPEAVDQWLSSEKLTDAHNLGLPTGSSNGIWVLDIDGQEGRDTLARFEALHGPLPATLISTTGRGQHLVFRHPGRTTIVPTKTAVLGSGVMCAATAATSLHRHLVIERDQGTVLSILLFLWQMRLDG